MVELVQRERNVDVDEEYDNLPPRQVNQNFNEQNENDNNNDNLNVQNAAVDDTEVTTDCFNNLRVRDTDSSEHKSKENKNCKHHKKKPLCIRITQNPLFKLIPWSIVSSTPIVGLYSVCNILQKLGIPDYSLHWYCHIAFSIWISIQVVYNFVMASITQPGYVSPDDAPENFLPPQSGHHVGKYKLFTPTEYKEESELKKKYGLERWRNFLPPRDGYERSSSAKMSSIEMSNLSAAPGPNSDENLASSESLNDNSNDSSSNSPDKSKNKSRTSSSAVCSFDEAFAEYDKKEAPMNLYYAPRYCAKCKVWKPPRCHHDSVTGRCVLRMDHYCPFTGNVIAVNNHGHFILMYIFAIVGLCYSLFMCVNVVLGAAWVGSGNYANGEGKILPRDEKGNVMEVPIGHVDAITNRILGDYGIKLGSNEMMNDIDLDQYAHIPTFNRALVVIKYVFHWVSALINLIGLEVVALLIMTGIFLFLVGACGGPAIWFASINVTALEYNVQRLNEYIEISPQVFCPIGVTFYMQESRLENLKMIMGDNWMMRLLLPVKGKVDWRMLGYEMPISPIASDQIKMRIEQWQEEGTKIPERSYAELGITAPTEGPNVGVENMVYEQH